MIFETHTLTSPLDKYIEAIFYFKDFMPEHSIERVVPTGHLFIIFELDGFVRNTFDNDSLKPDKSFSKAWISGMHKNYISISAHEKSEMFVIQFKAFGAYPFLHQPIEELNEQVLAAEEIFGDEVISLQQQILVQKKISEKFHLANEWLNKRFSQDKTPPVELLSVMARLQNESVVNFAEIVDSYSKTRKHLIDQFKKYVGLTPKYYQRILRFNEILQRIHKKEKIDWAEIAYQCEYTDQSHFIKEFKHFSGFNPQKFISQQHHKAEPNFFPLDKHNHDT